MTVFIAKGDPALTGIQAINRGLTHFNNELRQYERETGLLQDDPTYRAWASQWLIDNQINTENNIFNISLEAFRKASDRLARYQVSLGQAEITVERATGETDPETGAPMMETVILQRAIDPLEPMIERPTFDPETGEPTGAEMVPNPAIVADEAQRADAQALIDATPQDVKDWAPE